MKFINWIRPSFQDNDGTASYRRLTAFVFVLVDCYLVTYGRIQTSIMLNVHYSILAFILVLTGIITIQNILQFLKSKQ